MKRLIMASITAVVVIVVLAGTLIPILDDATATSDTFTNEGYFDMKEYASTDTIPTITWDYTTPKKITVGSDVLDLPDSPTFAVSMIFTDSWAFRYAPSTATVYVQLFGEGAGILYAASTADSNNMTVTFNEGTATFDNGSGTTKELTYTTLYSIAADGDYVMKAAAESAYVNGDSVIFVTGRSTVNFGSNVQLNLYFEGSIDDGYTATLIYPDTGYTFSDYNANYVADGDHNDLYELTGVSFTATDSNEVSATVTYSQFVVPAEVAAERAVHFTDGENAIFNAIPVMIIIALLLGVVALVLRSRMD